MSTRTTIFIWDPTPNLGIHLYHELTTNRYTLAIGKGDYPRLVIPLWKKRG